MTGPGEGASLGNQIAIAAVDQFPGVERIYWEDATDQQVGITTAALLARGHVEEATELLTRFDDASLPSLAVMALAYSDAEVLSTAVGIIEENVELPVLKVEDRLMILAGIAKARRANPGLGRPWSDYEFDIDVVVDELRSKAGLTPDFFTASEGTRAELGAETISHLLQASDFSHIPDIDAYVGRLLPHLLDGMGLHRNGMPKDEIDYFSGSTFAEGTLNGLRRLGLYNLEATVMDWLLEDSMYGEVVARHIVDALDRPEEGVGHRVPYEAVRGLLQQWNEHMGIDGQYVRYLLKRGEIHAAYTFAHQAGLRYVPPEIGLKEAEENVDGASQAVPGQVQLARELYEKLNSKDDYLGIRGSVSFYAKAAKIACQVGNFAQVFSLLGKESKLHPNSANLVASAIPQGKIEAFVDEALISSLQASQKAEIVSASLRQLLRHPECLGLQERKQLERRVAKYATDTLQKDWESGDLEKSGVDEARLLVLAGRYERATDYFRRRGEEFPATLAADTVLRKAYLGRLEEALQFYAEHPEIKETSSDTAVIRAILGTSIRDNNESAARRSLLAIAPIRRSMVTGLVLRDMAKRTGVLPEWAAPLLATQGSKFGIVDIGFIATAAERAKLITRQEWAL